MPRSARRCDARARRIATPSRDDDDDDDDDDDGDGGEDADGTGRRRRWVLPGVDAPWTRDDRERGVATTGAGGVLAGGFHV
jgi:hypothetical protein